MNYEGWLKPDSEIKHGERSRPGCSSARPALNSEDSRPPTRWNIFTPHGEPRGRGSLRPRPARSPDPTWEFGLKINAFREFTDVLKINAGLTSSAGLQSQRDCVLQPKVARHELPWAVMRWVANPNGVAVGGIRCATTPLGLQPAMTLSQGSSRLRCAAARHAQPWALWRNPFGIQL